MINCDVRTVFVFFFNQDQKENWQQLTIRTDIEVSEVYEPKASFQIRQK